MANEIKNLWFEALGELGYTQDTLQKRWRAFLENKTGLSLGLGVMTEAWLESLGYTGNLMDMWENFWYDKSGLTDPNLHVQEYMFEALQSGNPFMELVMRRLEHHWTFDEGSGLIVYDHVGCADGNILNTSDFWIDPLFGTFDGIDDYIDVPAGTSLVGLGEPGDQITLMMAVYLDTDDTYGALFHGLRASTVIQLFTKSHHPIFVFRAFDNIDRGYKSDVALSTEEWHIVTLAYEFANGASIKFNIDGTPVTGSWTQGNGYETTKYGRFWQAWLGRAGNKYLKGKLADCLIYSTILTDDEITSNVNFLNKRLGK